MFSKIVIIVVAIVAIGGAGYYGYGVGRQAGITEVANLPVTATTQGTTGRFPGAQGQGGQFPGGQAQGQGGQAQGQGGQFPGNPAAGGGLAGLAATVESIDGRTLTVNLTIGQQTQQVKVTLAEGGVVQQIAGGAATDIKVGSRIQIVINTPQAQPGATPPAQGQGQQIPSEVTARSITILPAQ